MNRVLKPYLQPSFLVCAVVLAFAAGFKEAAIEWSGAKLKKLPLPLKRSLDDMDEAKLGRYKVVQKTKIENHDILESLGTTDYIQWFLEDTQADASSPVRFCSLFITYYTGDPDRVPHVPEECITGAGDQMLSGEIPTLKLDLGNANISGIKIENGKADLNIRYLGFSRKNSNIWESDFNYGVTYFFKVNGKFSSTRDGTRAIMGQNLFGKYSYFSKVEWKFLGQASGGTIYGDKDEVLAASEKLLGVLLPILESDHWPDWEKANQEE